MLLLMLVASVSVVPLIYFMRKLRCVSGSVQRQNSCHIRNALYLEETYISYSVIYTEEVTMCTAYFKVK
jgi:hypothetical protein